MSFCPGTLIHGCPCTLLLNTFLQSNIGKEKALEKRKKKYPSLNYDRQINDGDRLNILNSKVSDSFKYKRDLLRIEDESFNFLFFFL